MRALILIAGAALALTSVSASALPLPPATSDKLETIATALEGMHGPSRIVDQRMADMIRPLAAMEGVTVPAIAPPYTQYSATAEKLRPLGWTLGTIELPNGWLCATFQKWDKDGYLEARYEKSGRNSVATTEDYKTALAISAAEMRAWAQELRDQGQ